MKFKITQPNKKGDTRIVNKFAWFPVRTTVITQDSDDSIMYVWLELYQVRQLWVDNHWFDIATWCDG